MRVQQRRALHSPKAKSSKQLDEDEGSAQDVLNFPTLMNMLGAYMGSLLILRWVTAIE
jgi:hypothetical protein